MRFAISLAAFLLLAGCAAPQPVVLGRPPAGSVDSVSKVYGSKAGETHLVAGVIVDKCPVAGCWFDLKDSTGVLRVDTKNAGFVVLDVPLGTKVQVAGQVSKVGRESTLDASGLRY